MLQLLAFLRLLRPANLFTAMADILAGATVAGVLAFAPGQLEFPPRILWLLLATCGLYGGGVVFNDVFDYERDCRERPERVLPKGRVSVAAATYFGAICLLVGVLAALMVSMYSMWLTLSVALLTLIYNRLAKHFALWGPMVMGLCRAGNLLLGMSIVPLALLDMYYLAFIPLVYIGAVTLISQGEVNGGNRGAIILALVMYAGVLTGLSLQAAEQGYLWESLVLDLVFVLLAAWPALRAYHQPQPEKVKTAVKYGVLGIVAVDALLATAFGGLYLGSLVLILLPISLIVGRWFQVT